MNDEVNSTKDTKDVFISHAGADKEKYIIPLQRAFDSAGITYWLDSQQIKWGDNIVTKIQDGLSRSKFVLVCLSENFLQRPWPESEFSSALTIQNSNGVKRVLPLICDSKDEVLKQYPLLAPLAYRLWDVDTNALVQELKSLLKSGDPVPTLDQQIDNQT